MIRLISRRQRLAISPGQQDSTTVAQMSGKTQGSSRIWTVVMTPTSIQSFPLILLSMWSSWESPVVCRKCTSTTFTRHLRQRSATALNNCDIQTLEVDNNAADLIFYSFCLVGALKSRSNYQIVWQPFHAWRKAVTGQELQLMFTSLWLWRDCWCLAGSSISVRECFSRETNTHPVAAVLWKEKPCWREAVELSDWLKLIGRLL